MRVRRLDVKARRSLRIEEALQSVEAASICATTTKIECIITDLPDSLTTHPELVKIPICTIEKIALATTDFRYELSSMRNLLTVSSKTDYMLSYYSSSYQ